MIQQVRNYINAGLCALPANREMKFPIRQTGKWGRFKDRLPTDVEIDAWFANDVDGVCIVCGETSDNLEALDFDACGERFPAWEESIPRELFERLVIEQTPSGGYHVFYRSEETVCGSLKLAMRNHLVAEEDIYLDNKGIEKALVYGKECQVHRDPEGPPYASITLIETKGKGGVIMCDPTAGYELLQGDLCNLPVLTSAERDVLLQTALDLDECPKDNADNGGCPADNVDSRPWSADNADSPRISSDNPNLPGSDYNVRGDVRSLLQSHGWVRIKGGENEYWRRPGKDKGNSATFKGKSFYVFSPNAAPFKERTSYSPFWVYVLLEHNGDKTAAASALSAQGYGSGPEVDPSVDLSAIVGMSADCAADNADIATCPADNADNATCAADNANSLKDMPPIRSLAELIREFKGLNRPIIHGLLREGETMNIIASPKAGKSWLASNLAISVAAGIDWLGMSVAPGRVLHIDNELHANTTTYRYMKICEAMGVDPAICDENIDVLSLRGHLRDLYAMSELFERVEAGEYNIVIVDAFYRTLPEKVDENDNGAIANLYNHIDRYAGELDCAFVLIHHTSKGNQAGKSVTDVGAGAGSQSRAADAHLVIRPHEEDDVVVLECACRSWAPMEPKALLWDWPVFKVTNEVDTSALQGLAKAKVKSKEIDLVEFVEKCVAQHDPCSKASVRHDAARMFDLPDRKADDRLQVAIDRDIVSRIKCGARMMYVKNRGEVTGDKALQTAAMIFHNPEMNSGLIAEKMDVSRQYVNQIRRSLCGNSSETGKKPVSEKVETSFHEESHNTNSDKE